MAKVATKLFRELEEAKHAVGDLKAKGYKAEEIGVIANEKRGKELGADIKAVSDVGKLAKLGIPEETVNYYQYGVAAGGIVVSVQADESRIAAAQEVLRGATCACESSSLCDVSPGFLKAGRMSATNPLDAQMSGEFRKY
jgi:hypothetical protein